MSGHSKWATTKRKKAIIDSKRGKAFSKLSKEISVAARGGGDPNFNFQLRLAIDRAKAVNMPKDNIDRAIVKGAGGGEGADLKELVYEGYGPAGSAFIITTLTDNPNRTANDLKHIFTKNNGNMGAPGSVMWQFDKLGVIIFKSEGIDQESIELELIEAGAEDIKKDNDEIIVYSKVENLQKIKEALEVKDIAIESADIEYIAKENINIKEDEEAKVEKLIDALEDQDDVSDVFANL